MKRLFLLVSVLGLWFAAECDVGCVRAAESVDVVVYGGTSAGIIAAVQAHRLGKSVVLIEPSNHLGGLTTGGLGATDIGNKSVIGGLARDFYHRVWQNYQDESAWNRETRKQYFAKNPRNEPKDETTWTFEPHVATQIYRELLADAQITPQMGERHNRQNGLKKNAGRIESITMESGRMFTGKVFIDATYEGDLMAAAGVAFHVGREANSVYDETLNGVQAKLNTKNHRFTKAVDPYLKPGDATSGLLPGIQVTKLPPMGQATKRCRRTATGYARQTWPKIAALGLSLRTTTRHIMNFY